MIDTHKIVMELEKAGFSAQQAETLTNALKQTQDQGLTDLVTKKDSDIRLHDELEPVRRDLHLLKWQVNLMIAGIMALILKAFFLT
jgi:hypothetical protein